MSSGRGDRRRRGGRGGAGGGHSGRSKRPPPDQQKNVETDENSPVIKMFRGYQNELDCRHDKYERVVKLSRDITIDSKRTIFLLQRAISGDTEKILSEAEVKFAEIGDTKWRSVASELQNEDPYQFLRAYSPVSSFTSNDIVSAYIMFSAKDYSMFTIKGLQEYVEAVSFWYYLKNDALISWKQIQDGLIFTKVQVAKAVEENFEAEQGIQKDVVGNSNVSTTVKLQSDTTTDSTVQVPHSQVSEDGTVTSTDDVVPQNITNQNRAPSAAPEEQAATAVSMSENTDCVDEEGQAVDGVLRVHVPPIEYMLGLADLTGELMRLAISSVGKGQLERPHRTCDFMRIIYDAFLSYGNISRELSRKMTTLRQSLGKVENACYMLQVRGSEVPKHMLMDVISSVGESDFDTGDMEV